MKDFCNNERQTYLYINLAPLEVLPINSLQGLNKKVFKIHLVSCFTIRFSSRAPTLHPPDLLGSPSDLIAFHKSLGLPIHSLSLFSKNSFFFFVLRLCKITISCFFINLFIYMKLAVLYFLKSLSRIIRFSEISLSNFLTSATLSMTSISF